MLRTKGEKRGRNGCGLLVTGMKGYWKAFSLSPLPLKARSFM